MKTVLCLYSHFQIVIFGRFIIILFSILLFQLSYIDANAISLLIHTVTQFDFSWMTDLISAS